MKHGEVRDRREILRTGAVEIGLELEEATLDRLLRFEELLASKAIPLGFVARSDGSRLLERHVLDSLRAAAIPKASDRTALDLGSGAGLPGVVVALACPGIEAMILVESQRRRVAFLELAVERLELSNVRLAPSRVEELPEGTRADLCLTRAFASPERSWTAAEPYLSDTGRLVYFAGEGTEFRAPVGARIVEVVPPALESSGPLVIMAR